MISNRAISAESQKTTIWDLMFSMQTKAFRMLKQNLSQTMVDALALQSMLQTTVDRVDLYWVLRTLLRLLRGRIVSRIKTWTWKWTWVRVLEMLKAISRFLNSLLRTKIWINQLSLLLRLVVVRIFQMLSWDVQLVEIKEDKHQLVP